MCLESASTSTSEKPLNALPPSDTESEWPAIQKRPAWVVFALWQINVHTFFMIQFLSKKQLEPFIKGIFLDRKVQIKPLAGGLLNQNFLLCADRRRFVLKIFRTEVEPEKFEEVRRVMRFARQHGIPTSVFLESTKIAGHIVVLDWFAPGKHPSRFKKTPQTVRAMGSMLGRIHAALDQFHTHFPKKSPQDLISWNRKEFLREIQTIRRATQRSKIVSAKNLQTALDIYQDIVEQDDDWDIEPFLKLPIRVCHGDYHTQNILVQNEKITAVLDWEKLGWQWRSFEIMRSLIFNCRKNYKELDWESVSLYLKAYREYGRLSDREKELTFESGFRKTLFSLWIEKQYLKTGDKDLLDGMKRRVMILPWLAAHRKESAERIAELL